MLLCEYLCGRHQATLVSIIRGHEHTHQRNNGFSATHIALQEPVHLPPRTGILPDFFHHPFLRTCETEGEVVFIKIIEQGTHFFE